MANVIIMTEDGSPSLLNTELDETYHSRHGAWQESVHVFINNGLTHLLGTSRQQVNVFEVGFGTGLNAFLTLQQALKTKVKIHYTTIEAFPLQENIWTQLNYVNAADEQRTFFDSLHTTDWNVEHTLFPNFVFEKHHTTLQKVTLDAEKYDLVYFDAFAPSKQPEMWEMPMLEKVAAAMASNAVLVTYCAKGQLKRDLKALGLQVETLAGPPGKKEMVRALKH